MVMARQTLLQLSDDLVARLDASAQRRGTSRSALVRELLEAALERHDDDPVGRRIVAGYRAIPQSDGVDEWGDLDAWSEAVARRNLIALAEEEREPW